MTIMSQLIPITVSAHKISYQVKLGIRVREKEPVRFTLHLTDDLGHEGFRTRDQLVEGLYPNLVST
jgi:hypothetical protein